MRTLKAVLGILLAVGAAVGLVLFTQLPSPRAERAPASRNPWRPAGSAPPAPAGARAAARYPPCLGSHIQSRFSWGMSVDQALTIARDLGLAIERPREDALDLVATSDYRDPLSGMRPKLRLFFAQEKLTRLALEITVSGYRGQLWMSGGDNPATLCARYERDFEERYAAGATSRHADQLRDLSSFYFRCGEKTGIDVTDQKDLWYQECLISWEDVGTDPAWQPDGDLMRRENPNE